jgi:hypothetical protein
MLFALLALHQADSAYIRAESLLAARTLGAARAAAEQLVTSSPNDPRAHLLLGRVWYAWPVTGRYAALAEFRQAARLAPKDPEPLSWQVRVGRHLGADDGEAIAREAILRILALTPDYEDCWSLFESMYHNETIWRRADRALARHPGSLIALERRARIAIALEEPERVDSLTSALLARHTPHLAAYLLRAEAAFDGRHDSAGYAWYDSALTYADTDSMELLWDAVWMIASPAEVARQHATPPGGRRRFFEWFWGSRDPNLVTRENERIAEHYRRLKYVRRMFHLLHPWGRYHHAAAARTLQAYRDRVIQQEAIAGQPGAVPHAFGMALLSPHLGSRDAPEAEVDVQFRAGLDTRGLLWVRHGPPDLRQTGVLDPIRGIPARELLDEGWLYSTSDGDIVLSFTSHGGGDARTLPFTPAQLEGQRRLLETDRTSLPAVLDTRGWSAFFRSGTPGRTDLYVRVQPGTAAAVLWDSGGAGEIVRASGTGLLRLTAPPARYQLGLDVDSAGVLGRVRQPVRLPGFAPRTPTISSLVVAAGDSAGDRELALSGMPPDLRYPSGAVLSTYAELYGLSPDRDGRARYLVRYTFQPLRSLAARLMGAASPVVFEFTREAEWRGTLPEHLVIQPGRLAPGRYRVTLAVTDAPSNVKSETVALDITVH